MNVQWVTWVMPTFSFRPEFSEPVFPTSTAGWTWEEGGWVGYELARRGHTLDVGHLIRSGPEVTVFGAEVFAANRLMETGTRQSLGKVGVRCVCGPGAGDSDVWKAMALNLPTINGLSTIGEREAVELQAWAERNGYKGTPIDVTPLGAEYFEAGLGPRSGFAYLGSVVKNKHVPHLVEAALLADVELTLALVYSNQHNAADLGKVTHLAAMSRKIKLTQVGLHSRKLLLASVRGAVTMSYADSQWLPGTEARACGGIAIAANASSLPASNGNAIMYAEDSVEGMAAVLKKMNDDNVAYEAERSRQQLLFHSSGRDSVSVGAKLANWVCGMAAHD